MDTLLVYIGTVFLFLVIPGPVNLAVVNNAGRYGFKGLILSVIATNAASLVLIAAAGIILSGIGKINEQWLTALSGIGGVYLFYYGVQMCRSFFKPAFTPVQNSGQTPGSRPFSIAASSFLIAISNPKDVIFFMTFFPPFIMRLNMDLIPALLLLTFIWCILDYLILIAYGLGFSRLLGAKGQRILYLLSGAVFIALGIYAAWNGINAVFMT